MNTIAFTLTPTELSALISIAHCDYWDGPVRTTAQGSCGIWANTANNGPLSGKVFAGACSSLQSKGVIRCDGTGRDACIIVTDAGLAAMIEAGLLDAQGSPIVGFSL